MIKITEDLSLPMYDAYKLVLDIMTQIKEESLLEAQWVAKQIKKHECLKKSILNDVIECQHFIDDLRIIELPVRLLPGGEENEKDTDNI